jgi:hypothetical protein
VGNDGLDAASHRAVRGSRGAGRDRARGAGGDADPCPADQRIDIKVLLVSADGTEPGFGAWKAELQREGVPYSTFVA